MSETPNIVLVHGAWADGSSVRQAHRRLGQRHRVAMLDFFDLWSFDDVKANADAILAAVRAGSMPCDAPWSTEKVDLLERWVNSGTPR